MPGAVKFSSAPNFRAVAQYEVAGGHVRGNRLYRSQGLHTLSDADLQVLKSLDVRLVCDLRSARERALQVSRWPTDQLTPHMTVSSEVEDASQELLSIVRTDPSARGARMMMLANYERFPARFVQTLTELFARLIAPAPRHGVPVLVHCSVGKDRTGFIVAVVLAALHTPRDAIIDDYVLTAHTLSESVRIAITEKAMGAMHGFLPDRAALEVIASVDPTFLDAAFRAIDLQFGSLENYLSTACGLTSNAREALLYQLVAT